MTNRSDPSNVDLSDAISVSIDFIKETNEFKRALHQGSSPSQAINEVLYAMGMETDNKSMYKGLVRCLKDKRKGFNTTVYMGLLRKDYKHGYLYNSMEHTVIVPENVTGREIIDLDIVGTSFYNDQRHMEELENAQEQDEMKTQTRTVRQRKFKVEDVADFMK